VPQIVRLRRQPFSTVFDGFPPFRTVYHRFYGFRRFPNFFFAMFFIRIIHHGGTESTEEEMQIEEFRMQNSDYSGQIAVEECFNRQSSICNLQLRPFPLRVLRDSVVMTLKQ
jgi:hypothetical protein